MEIDRNKKLTFYTPGLISLLLLPSLCICYFYYSKVTNLNRTMEINMFTKDNWKNVYFGNKRANFYLHPNISFHVINISRDDKDAMIKLENAQVEIRNIISTKDTTKGVRFHFDNNSKYWTWIRAFDICCTEKAWTFIPNENDIWVYNYFPIQSDKKKYEKTLFCNSIFYKNEPSETDLWLNDNTNNQKEPNLIMCATMDLENERLLVMQNLKDQNEKNFSLANIIKTFKTNLLSGLLFILLSILSIRRLVK